MSTPHPNCVRHLWASLLTYRCENGGSKEHRLYVAPWIDALLGFKIDSLLGCHRNCLFVFEQFIVDVFTVNHRIPTSVENKSNKIFPFQDDQSLKLSQFTFFKGMLNCLEYLKKNGNKFVIYSRFSRSRQLGGRVPVFRLVVPPR